MKTFSQLTVGDLFYECYAGSMEYETKEYETFIGDRLTSAQLFTLYLQERNGK